MDKAVSVDLEEIMQKRGIYRSADEKDEKIYPTQEVGEQFISCAMPIVSDGDVVGCVVSLQSDDKDARRDAAAKETEIKLVSTAASFLGKQMEQ